MKNEFQVIADLIEKDKKVLDVGCADGTLMKFLKDNKNINIRGLEISKEKVQECIAKGLTVIEGNAEKDLKQFPDKSFDYVVLSQTLQAFLNPENNLIPPVELINVFNNIRKWAEERGLYEKGDTKTQLIKLYEESGELSQALLKNNKEDIIDAIGDSVVVLTNLAHLVGTDIETCVQSAYDEISNRTGRMINGTFIKDE